jgi:hypothetical protein
MVRILSEMEKCTSNINFDGWPFDHRNDHRERDTSYHSYKICSVDLLNGHEWRKVGCVVENKLEFRQYIFVVRTYKLDRNEGKSFLRRGQASLNHLSIFYNISCYNSLVQLTFVSMSSCRITYIYIKVWNKPNEEKGGPEFEYLWYKSLLGKWTDALFVNTLPCAQ